jgi:hypothetical protein
MSINPIWRYGPYDPSKVTAGAKPDWYLAIAEGLLRIFPNWETQRRPEERRQLDRRLNNGSGGWSAGGRSTTRSATPTEPVDATRCRT